MAVEIGFIVSAVVCVLSALLIVTRRNPVYSVVHMLPFFLAMTLLFVLLQATFLAAIQLIVYGGAILIVFLFVIMLINLKPEELRDDFSLRSYLVAAGGVGLLGGVFLFLVNQGVTPKMEEAFAAAAVLKPGGEFGSIGNLAYPLFKYGLVPFELASVLIVVAILGAVLLSKKKV